MSSRARNGDPSSVCCLGKESDGEVELTVAEETERVPFDINLPVVLAGFAFEAYTSPPVHIALRLRSGHRLLPPVQIDTERVLFDINLPVVLAGFAFEAYTSPPVQIALRFRSVRTRKVRTTRTTRRRADSSSSKPRVRPGERHRRGASGIGEGRPELRRGQMADDGAAPRRTTSSVTETTTPTWRCLLAKEKEKRREW